MIAFQKSFYLNDIRDTCCVLRKAKRTQARNTQDDTDRKIYLDIYNTSKRPESFTIFTEQFNSLRLSRDYGLIKIS